MARPETQAISFRIPVKKVDALERLAKATDGHCGHRRDRRSRAPNRTSGNLAFDEYREETLKRLEQEQQEFTGFLERLRGAKDKSEFDQFLADRRNTPDAPEVHEVPEAHPQG